MVEEGCRPRPDVGLEAEKLARFVQAVVDLGCVLVRGTWALPKVAQRWATMWMSRGN